MTVNAETPTTTLLASGSNTDFSFSWSSQDIIENLVEVDGVLQGYQIDYEIVDFTLENGGTARFFTPPPNNAEVRLFRRTPISQQLDYTEFTRFPAESHEGQMDKDTRILQELYSAGAGLGGVIDLDALQNEDSVDVLNTGGADARIPSWDCVNPLAGVFHGTAVEVGQAPLDGANTDKPDGFIWLELDPAP